MEPEAAIYFRDQFRQARAGALQDAEGFQEILFVLERLGYYRSGKEVGSLRSYQGTIVEQAKHSPLAADIPTEHPTWHSEFVTIYELVREARNDALHQGAFARHLTDHAIQLALVLEDALMSDVNTAADFMVRDPVSASLWQPISFIRQQMLKNSFTYLPLLRGRVPLRWALVSDYHVAEYLRQGNRNKRLATKFENALEDGFLLEQVEMCSPQATAEDVLKMSQGKPVLVVDEYHLGRLLGIVTPFDLL